MRALKNFMKPLAVAIAVAGLITACGDGTRNDHGTGFTLAGFFNPGTAPPIRSAPGVSGVIMPISATGGGVRPAAPEVEIFGSRAGAVTVSVGLQNNLSTVAIRTGRVHYDYFIPGAALSIPGSSWGVPGYLTSPGGDPGGPAGDLRDDSTLPDQPLATESITEVVLLPPDVRTFLNLQRTQLPEPPFHLIIGAYVTGVTSAGQDIRTNRMEIEALVTTDNVIPPTEGDETGGGGGEGEVTVVE